MFNSFNRALAMLIVGLASLCSLPSQASGLLQAKHAQHTELEIRQHHVNVVIENGYAITSIEQVFFNPNQQDLEAHYSFPVPRKAAVSEFSYWINGQQIVGEVIEKQRAKKIYQQEKSQGREVAVTEQNDFKTFSSKVYPVRAQQEVRIQLAYIQAAHVDTGIGRYVYPLEDGGVDEHQLAFWTNNDKVTEQFSFNLTFRSAYPVSQFRLPKHPSAQITQVSAQEWQVSLGNNKLNNGANNGQFVEEGANAPPNNQNSLGVNQPIFSLNQDIVVYWRHQDGLPGSVDLVTYKKPNERKGTFMLTLTPGDDLSRITEGRDWVFVLDYSGSMQGKYQSMVDGIQQGLAKLNPDDRFRLVIFNDSAQEITSHFVNATPQNVNQWIETLSHYQPGGSTNLYDGVKLGIKSLDADRSSGLILIIDGVANVGVTEKKRFLQLMEKRDVRLFTFVMGNSANRPLLESMTNISNGFALNVSNSDDITGQLMQATSKLSHQALHDIELEFNGVKVGDITPERITSLYRGQQLIVFGHYWGDGQVEIELTGKVSGQKKHYRTQFEMPKQSELNVSA
ncbi:hypothetical protein C2869_19655 [Saccharobesus litoralis]|uniref:VWA domain-containing protein n=1 Tax=Saccharobesus litoralis TaxID=2172099 RepID=A0A2S0VW83_9ALTE|nr:VIT and VWA domain-containing protein [Saccharobesus litoralis]AWB68479.1 hypothetical protein C2869_19655 [Saccharobesus litoralis]